MPFNPVPKKGKKKTLSELMHRADYVYSRYWRQFHADKLGRVVCHTCGKAIKHWKEAQIGHLIKRGHKAARYLLHNTCIQCSWCNCTIAEGDLTSGNVTKHREYVLKVYGPEKLDELDFIDRNYKMSRGEYEAIIDHYTELLEEAGYEY